MSVLIDTSVWSLAFRKSEKTSAEQTIVTTLSEYARDLKSKIIGPIRQEVLSGISSKEKFETVRLALSVLPDIEISTECYELAAEYFNLCRGNGIQGSHIDFLICAVATIYSFKIFTLDKDFDLFKEHIDLQIVKIS